MLYVQSQLMDTLMLSTGALLSLGVLSVGHSRPETLPAIGLVLPPRSAGSRQGGGIRESMHAVRRTIAKTH